MIEIAKAHKSNDSRLKDLNYVCSSIEEHSAKNECAYDAVVASEIIEHIRTKKEFVSACVRCLKPGGSIFVTTLNKTFFSFFGGVLMAETVLRILPRGTHEWDLFISPVNMQRMLEDGELIYSISFLWRKCTNFYSAIFKRKIELILHI